MTDILRNWVDFIPILIAAGFGYGMGYYRERAKMLRQSTAALLFIVLKLRKRGVFLSPLDVAIIQEAANRVSKGNYHANVNTHPVP